MTERCFAYVTAPAEAEAKRIAAQVIERKLAACANVSGPITSIYRWDGAIQQDPEWVIIFKTTEGNRDALIKAVVDLHPYDCPCVVFLPIAHGHPPFLDWIASETQP